MIKTGYDYLIDVTYFIGESPHSFKFIKQNTFYYNKIIRSQKLYKIGEQVSKL